MRRSAANEEESPPPRELDTLAVELLRHANSALPPSESDVLLDLERDGLRCLLTRTPAEPSEPPLSPREHEIARMVAEGHPNKSIAAVLEISTWTVGTHLRRIFAKLGVTSRAAMVARLLRK
jgi:DNA-binding CsgD family transcriptional regulator